MGIHPSRITEERRIRAFERSMTFQQFVEAAQSNQDLLRRNFELYELSEQDLAYFSNLHEPIDVLALAQDWCTDVASNLPLFAKIEEATGNVKLHIINRDPDNIDIAEAYPHEDGHSRIPTYIFFNKSGEHLGTFIERPAVISEYFAKWGEQFWDTHPDLSGRGERISDLEESVKKLYIAYSLSQRSQVRNEEKDAIVTIIQTITG